MKRQMEKTRASLGDLAGLAGKTEAAERRILAGAQKRLTTVQAELERARPGVDAAPEKAQDRYLDLVRERGQLEIVISKSRAALNL